MIRTRWLAAPVLLAALVGCVTKSSSETASASSSSSATTPGAPAETSKLDSMMAAAWSAAGVSPSGDVDDATYLRRISIDLLGRIPSAAELSAFTADGGSDKRARAVERLLDSPEHAKHLARMWDRILLGPEVKQKIVDRGALRRWLEQRFAADAPWDQTVRELVAAEGKTSVGGAAMGARLDENVSRGDEERTSGINGAANFPLRFAKSPQDMAGQTSRVFLGVQIQCAQCHDHKTEKWTQSDFRGFAAAFTRVRVVNVERTKGEMPIVEIESTERPARRMSKNEETAEIAKVSPRALDGKELSNGDPREALGAWMTAKDSPYFARAMVNRVWAELMGQGFVDPVDDMRPSNEAILPAVLDTLAADFQAKGYALDWLYATIATSAAYAKSAGEGDARAALFSHASLRPLSGDALLDSLFVATEVDKRMEDAAPERVEQLKTMVRRRMTFVFEEDAESNAEGYDGTLQQALFTMNGALPIAATTYAEGSLLERLVDDKSDAEIIEELYLRTLGRAPRAEEIGRAKALLGGSTAPDPAGAPEQRKNRQQKKAEKRAARKGGGGAGLPAQALRSEADDARERGFEDLFWALVNSSEFSFRR